MAYDAGALGYFNTSNVFLRLQRMGERKWRWVSVFAKGGGTGYETVAYESPGAALKRPLSDKRDVFYFEDPVKMLDEVRRRMKA